MREIAQKLSRCSSFGALMDDAFARCPEREAIVYEDWRLTYGDLERYIHQTAHYLRHLGVRKGSRVAILSRNCPEWIIAEFALYQLGAIVVKINWRLTPPEQARMLARNQVSVAFLKAEKPEWGAELERLCADSVRLIRLEPGDGTCFSCSRRRCARSSAASRTRRRTCRSRVTMSPAACTRVARRGSRSASSTRTAACSARS